MLRAASPTDHFDPHHHRHPPYQVTRHVRTLFEAIHEDPSQLHLPSIHRTIQTLTLEERHQLEILKSLSARSRPQQPNNGHTLRPRLDVVELYKHPGFKRDIDLPVFSVIPEAIYLHNYEIGKCYSLPIFFRNEDKIAGNLHVQGPGLSYLSLSPGRVKSGKIAPSISVQYQLRFSPTSVAASSHSITVTTDREQFTIPIHIAGAPTVLDVPDVLEFPFQTLLRKSSTTFLRLSNVSSKDCLVYLRTEEPLRLPKTSVLVPSQQQRQVPVYFEPHHLEHDLEKLEVQLQTDSGVKLFVRVRATIKTCQISLEKEELHVPPAFVGQERVDQVALVNSESDVVANFEWRLADRNSQVSFPVSIEPSVGRIWPKTRHQFTVHFRPEDEGSAQCELLCTVSGAPEPLSLQVFTCALGPRARLSYDILEVGQLLLNSERTFLLDICNVGQVKAPYKLSSARSDWYSFSPEEGVLNVDGQVRLKVTLTARTTGSIDDVIHVQLAGTSEDLSMRVRGLVYPPKVLISPMILDFGKCPIGFCKPSNFFMTLQTQLPASVKVLPEPNCSEDYHIEVPGGEILLNPYETKCVTPEFLPYHAKENRGTLSLYVDGAGELEEKVWFKGKGVEAKLNLVTGSLDCGKVFVNAMVFRCIQVDNPTQLPAHIEHRRVSYRKNKGEFRILGGERRFRALPNSTTNLPVVFKIAETGRFEISVPLHILHSSLSLNVIISGECVGPRIVIEPALLELGRIELLKSYTKPLSITNQSEIPSVISTIGIPEGFTMEETRFQLAPFEKYNTAVSVCFNDAGIIQKELVFKVVPAGVNVTLPVSAAGIGCAVEYHPGLRSVDFGTLLASRTEQCCQTFHMVNRSKRTYHFVWTDREISLAWHGTAGTDTREERAFEVLPARFSLDPGMSIAVQVVARSVTDRSRHGKQSKCFRCYCYDDWDPKRRPLLTSSITAEFIRPCLVADPSHVEFEYDAFRNTSNWNRFRYITLHNTSVVPVSLSFSCAPPFRTERSSAQIDPENKCEVLISIDKGASDLPLERVETGRLSIDASGHSFSIPLECRLFFPSLTFETQSDLNFGEVLPFKKHKRELAITNTGHLLARYRWILVGTREDCDNFSVGPMKGELLPGERVHSCVTFASQELRENAVEALCVVERGPVYSLRIAAKTVTLNWETIPNWQSPLVFQTSTFWEVGLKQIVIKNSGVVPFEVGAVIEGNRDHFFARTRKPGRALPGDKCFVNVYCCSFGVSGVITGRLGLSIGPNKPITIELRTIGRDESMELTFEDGTCILSKQDFRDMVGRNLQSIENKHAILETCGTNGFSRLPLSVPWPAGEIDCGYVDVTRRTPIPISIRHEFGEMPLSLRVIDHAQGTLSIPMDHSLKRLTPNTPSTVTLMLHPDDALPEDTVSRLEATFLMQLDCTAHGPAMSFTVCGWACRPTVRVMPRSLAFGEVLLGHRRSLPVTITNESWLTIKCDLSHEAEPAGNADLVGRSQREDRQLSLQSEFYLSDATLELLPRSSRVVFVYFEPRSSAYSETRGAIQTLLSDRLYSELSIELQGNPVKRNLTLSVEKLDFGMMLPFTEEVTKRFEMRNDSPIPLEISCLEFDPGVRCGAPSQERQVGQEFTEWKAMGKSEKGHPISLKVLVGIVCSSLDNKLRNTVNRLARIVGLSKLVINSDQPSASMMQAEASATVLPTNTESSEALTSKIKEFMEDTSRALVVVQGSPDFGPVNITKTLFADDTICKHRTAIIVADEGFVEPATSKKPHLTAANFDWLSEEDYEHLPENERRDVDFRCAKVQAKPCPNQDHVEVPIVEAVVPLAAVHSVGGKERGNSGRKTARAGSSALKSDARLALPTKDRASQQSGTTISKVPLPQTLETPPVSEQTANEAAGYRACTQWKPSDGIETLLQMVGDFLGSCIAEDRRSIESIEPFDEQLYTNLGGPGKTKEGEIFGGPEMKGMTLSLTDASVVDRQPSSALAPSGRKNVPSSPRRVGRSQHFKAENKKQLALQQAFLAETQRYVIQPAQILEFSLTVSPSSELAYSELLTFQAVGYREQYFLAVIGECGFPVLPNENKSLWFDKARKTVPKGLSFESIRKEYISSIDTFSFGYCIVASAPGPRQRGNSMSHSMAAMPAALNTSAAVTAFLTLGRILVPPNFPNYSVHLVQQEEDGTFTIDPAVVEVKSGMSQEIKFAVSCHPKLPGPTERLMYVCVSGNPQPVPVKFWCVGVKPEIRVEPVSLSFERVLVRQIQSRAVELRNPQVIPLYWRFVGLDGVEELSVDPSEGVLDPGEITSITIRVQSTKVTNLKKTGKVEVFDQAPHGAGVLPYQSEAVTIYADVYEPVVDVYCPKSSTRTVLDFDRLQNQEPGKLTVSLRNKSKHELAFRFGISRPDLLTALPSHGILPNADSKHTVAVTVTACSTKDLHLSGASDVIKLVCADPTTGETAVVINFSVSILVAGLRHKLEPELEGKVLDFGTSVSRERIRKSLTLQNIGVFDFKFQIAKIGALNPEEVTRSREKTERAGTAQVTSDLQRLNSSVRNQTSDSAISPCFSVNHASGTINPKQSAEVNLDFCPLTQGVYSENVVLRLTAKAGEVRDIAFRLMGRSVAPKLDSEHWSQIFPFAKIYATEEERHYSPPGDSWNSGSYITTDSVFHCGEIGVGSSRRYTVRLINLSPVTAFANPVARSRVPGVCSAFSVQPAGSVQIPKNGFVSLNLEFAPKTVGIQSGQFEVLLENISNDAPKESVSFEVLGEGCLPRVDLITDAGQVLSEGEYVLDFGAIPMVSVESGDIEIKTVTLKNTGSVKSSALLIDQGTQGPIKQSGEAFCTADFTLHMAHSTIELEPGETAEVLVTCSAPGQGRYCDVISIATQHNPYQRLQLCLKAEVQPPGLYFLSTSTPSIEGSTSLISSIDFGNVQSGSNRERSFVICAEHELSYRISELPDVTFTPSAGKVAADEPAVVTATWAPQTAPSILEHQLLILFTALKPITTEIQHGLAISHNGPEHHTVNVPDNKKKSSHSSSAAMAKDVPGAVRRFLQLIGVADKSDVVIDIRRDTCLEVDEGLQPQVLCLPPIMTGDHAIVGVTLKNQSSLEETCLIRVEGDTLSIQEHDGELARPVQDPFSIVLRANGICDLRAVYSPTTAGTFESKLILSKLSHSEPAREEPLIELPVQALAIESAIDIQVYVGVQKIPITGDGRNICINLGPVVLGHGRSIEFNVLSRLDLCLSVKTGNANGVGNISCATESVMLASGERGSVVFDLEIPKKASQLLKRPHKELFDLSWQQLGLVHEVCFEYTVVEANVQILPAVLEVRGIVGQMQGASAIVCNHSNAALPFHFRGPLDFTPSQGVLEPYSDTSLDIRFVPKASSFTMKGELTVDGTKRIEMQAIGEATHIDIALPKPSLAVTHSCLDEEETDFSVVNTGNADVSYRWDMPTTPKLQLGLLPRMAGKLRAGQEEWFRLSSRSAEEFLGSGILKLHCTALENTEAVKIYQLPVAFGITGVRASLTSSKQLHFGDCLVGMSATRTISVTNQEECPLLVTGHVASPPTMARVFSVSSSETGELVPRKSKTFQILFRPEKAFKNVTLQFVLEFRRTNHAQECHRGKTSYPSGTLNVPVRCGAKALRLVADPPHLKLEGLQLGSRVSYSIRIKNDNTIPIPKLGLTSPSFISLSRYHLSNILPHSAHEVVATFYPTTRIPRSISTINAYLVDTEGQNVSRNSPTDLVRVSASCRAPAITIEEFQLSNSSTLSSTSRTVFAHNEGDEPACCLLSVNTPADFSVSPLEFTVAPGLKSSFRVKFSPQSEHPSIKSCSLTCKVYGTPGDCNKTSRLSSPPVQVIQIPISCSVTPIPAPTDTVRFSAALRSQDVKTIAVTNAYQEPIRFEPSFSTPEFSWATTAPAAQPGQATQVSVRYVPLTHPQNSERHEGTLVLPWADGGALVYKLHGTVAGSEDMVDVTLPLDMKPHAIHLPISSYLDVGVISYCLTCDYNKSALALETGEKSIGSISLQGPSKVRYLSVKVTPKREGTSVVRFTLTFLASDTSTTFSYRINATKSPRTSTGVGFVQEKRHVVAKLRKQVSLPVPGIREVISDVTGVISAVQRDILLLRSLTLERTSLRVLSENSINEVIIDTEALTGEYPIVRLRTSVGSTCSRQVSIWNYERKAVELRVHWEGTGFSIGSPNSAALTTVSIAGAPSFHGIQGSMDVTYDPPSLGDHFAKLWLYPANPVMAPIIFKFHGHCSLPTPMGPILVRAGQSTSITLKNAFPNTRTFSGQCDNPQFYVKPVHETAVQPGKSITFGIGHKSPQSGVVLGGSDRRGGTGMAKDRGGGTSYMCPGPSATIVIQAVALSEQDPCGTGTLPRMIHNNQNHRTVTWVYYIRGT